MASWIKLPDNSYVQMAQLINVMATAQSDGTFIIQGTDSIGRVITLKTGFVSLAAAQTALDTAVTNLGGNV